MDQSQLGNEYRDSAEEKEEEEERLEQERCWKYWKEGAEREEEKEKCNIPTFVAIFECIFDIGSKYKAVTSGWR